MAESELPLVDENIGAFNVTMKYTLIMQILQTSQHLCDKNSCRSFCERTKGLNDVSQRTIFHESVEK